MNEDRKRILDMLAAGKLTADEAEMLLDALPSPPDSAAKTAGATAVQGFDKVMAAPGAPKYLFVRVDGKDKVDVKVPLGLLRAGLKLTSLIPPQAMDEINKSMSQAGMSIDFNNLKAEDIEEIIQSLREMEVNVVSESGDNIKVFCA